MELNYNRKVGQYALFLTRTVKGSMMYKVIGSVQSRAFRVLWLLIEMDLPFAHINAPPQSEEVKKYNPFGKIPILVDGVDCITDSNAIMTYLADKHSLMTQKAGTKARAHQDALLHKIIDEIDSVLWVASRSSLGIKDQDYAASIRRLFEIEYERNINHIVTQIKGPFIMGEELTLPDIVLAHCGGWAYVAKFPNQNEAFKKYLSHCRSRPAYQAAAGIGKAKI